MKPVYFDLTVYNAKEARKFFERVFNWHFEKFSMPYEYYRIQTGPSNEFGIDGGVGEVKDAKVGDGKPLTQMTIGVPNIDEFLERVTQNGGHIIEAKIAIPGIGWYATCTEPGGLLFGMLQADPNAR